jgi:hypothetical protein
MTAAVERLTQQISSLAPDEAREFYHVMLKIMPAVVNEPEDENSVEDEPLAKPRVAGAFLPRFGSLGPEMA